MHVKYTSKHKLQSGKLTKEHNIVLRIFVIPISPLIWLLDKCVRKTYSSLLICAHGRIKSNQRTFCKTTVQLEAAMDIVKKTRSY